MRFDILNVLNGAKRLNCLNGLNPIAQTILSSGGVIAVP
jgi:hypothetical protein